MENEIFFTRDLLPKSKSIPSFSPYQNNIPERPKSTNPSNLRTTTIYYNRRYSPDFSDEKRSERKSASITDVKKRYIPNINDLARSVSGDQNTKLNY